MIGPLPTAIATPDPSFLDGQVEVADGVALADGVVLNAAPGCRLILAPGVCLGSGVIIQAHGGHLVIEPGAVLGSGVLVVGAGRIGPNACIGADSTLINPDVLASQVVPANALWGDPIRLQGANPAESSQAQDQQRSTPEPQPLSSVSGSEEALPPESTDTSEMASSLPSDSSHAETEASDTADLIADADTATPNGTHPSPVHGQKQVQQLIATLFPHRQLLNGVSAKDKP